MGTYYTQGATRADIIREITAPTRIGPYPPIEGAVKGARTTIAKATKGGTLYAVHEDTYPDGKTERWIGVYLLSKAKDCGWGYKPMDESVHPYQYDCPLAFFALAPAVQCQRWRDETRRHHAARQRTITIGARYHVASGWMAIGESRPASITVQAVDGPRKGSSYFVGRVLVTHDRTGARVGASYKFKLADIVGELPVASREPVQVTA